MNKRLLRKNLVLLLLLFSFLSGHAQNFPVTGKVSDESGAPLEGATVLEKGTKNSTLTKDGGVFRLSVSSGKAKLIVSFVGHESQEIAVGDRANLVLALKKSNDNLSDIVVVGYGTVKRSDVTGAVAGINQKDIRSRPVDNALQAMQGKVAGVDIGSNERPGQLPTINIRGVRSLTASNTPLFVVDGIPIISGGIDNINPGDIESIDVLKDASATAIYGSRGANGVVILTTKQGKNGKVVIGVNSSLTSTNLVDDEKMMNASDYITFRRWGYYYAGLNANTGISTYPRGDQPDIAHDKTYFAATTDPTAWANIARGWAGGTWDGSKVSTTDWFKIVKQQSFTSDNVVSVAGGTDKIRAYGSFGYLKNNGTIKGQSFERYTARANIDFNAASWLNFGSNISVAYGSQEYGQSGIGIATIGTPAGGLYESARGLFSYAKPYDSLGNRILFPGGDNAVKNVVDEWKYNINERVTLRAFGSFYGQINVGAIIPALKGLRYRLNFGPDFSYFRDGTYIDANSVANGGSTSYASKVDSNTFSYTLDNLLYYDKSVGEHSFGVTLLASQTKYRMDMDSITGNGIPLASSLWNALTSGTVTGAISTKSNLTEQQLLSYMGRLNYGYKDKYLVTVSAREDGSSVLSAGHKFSWFPSAALAWRISKEGFMKATWVDDLKLRVGAGVTGNSAVQPYSTQGATTSLFYPFLSTNTAGSIPNAILANKNVGWEKTTQYNIGVDFHLFNSRVSGSADVYTSKTTDLLMSRSIPTVTGYTSTLDNVGETANKGVDISLTTVNFRQRNIIWTTTITAAWQKDHIVKLSNGTQPDINNGWFPGQPLSVIYGYKATGLWQAADKSAMSAFNANGNAFTPGSIRIQDVNGDNKIDPNNDRQIIGWTRPRWILGMTNTLSYKGWELSAFIYSKLHYMYAYGGEVEAGRYFNRQINYYTENNHNAQFQKPIFNAGGAAGDSYYASLGYLKASFIKVRNLSLAYNFNKSVTRNWATNLRAYFQVQNPGMIYSQIKFLDMDVIGPTWNRGFTFGINASF
ncbi:MAG TPA: TonB-dependent receptor [Puia sp.]|uniref:SusC/RagA family TonB-linked outer membrane protein n=1 Tax=Puia sp. TaxID=2045100 RepID=UPI002CD2B2ED|nr:TonB-dependent receptor [Puia sp.]HVU94792.1 TonB-dependent receptor [Puia sp.]